MPCLQIFRSVTSSLATYLFLCQMPLALAQSNAQRIQELIDRSKNAIVKLTVDGRTPSGEYKSIQGSGFFAYSGGGISLILTAGHIIGSSEIEQSKNRDWQVENGVVSRKISVSTFDDHGSLVLHTAAVDPVPTAFPGVDIVLLMIKQSGYVSLHSVDTIADSGGLKDVMLLGFAAGKAELSMPAPIGFGILTSPTKFSTNIPSRAGESGGPWIDLKSGLVLAVATGIQAGPNGPNFEATPVALIISMLKLYIPSVPPPRLPVVVTYRICTGEYRQRCPSDSIYQYCGASVAEWAKLRCDSFTSQRLDTFDGNKCGYSIDQIMCTSPK